MKLFWVSMTLLFAIILNAGCNKTDNQTSMNDENVSTQTDQNLSTMDSENKPGNETTSDADPQEIDIQDESTEMSIEDDPSDNVTIEDDVTEIERVDVDEKTQQAIIEIVKNGVLLNTGMQGTQEEVQAALTKARESDVSQCPEDFQNAFSQFIASGETLLNTASEMAAKQKSGAPTQKADTDSNDEDSFVSENIQIGSIRVDLTKLSEEDKKKIAECFNQVMKNLLQYQNTAVKYIGEDAYAEAIGLEEQDVDEEGVDEQGFEEE